MDGEGSGNGQVPRLGYHWPIVGKEAQICTVINKTESGKEHVGTGSEQGFVELFTSR